MMYQTLKMSGIALLSAMLLTACGQGDNASSAKPADNSASPKADTGTLTVRIATESNYKPFSYIDSSGNHQGFEIDLIHALCDEMKADCQISSQAWDSLIPGLQANKYDAIFASMSATEERKQVIQFSEPYFKNMLVLVGKKGDNTTIKELDGKTVAVQQATVAAQYLEKNHPKVTIKSYDKQVNAYLDLNAGRVDFLLSDIAPASDWLKTPEGANFEIKGENIDINDNVAIGLRQADTELAGKFNAALQALKDNGKYNQIYGNYFATETK